MKINPEYSNLINLLSSLEYQVLKNSISEKGLYLPIIVNQDNVILDGHHRYKICKELGIEPYFEVKRFNDPLDEKVFVIEINVQRRQLNDFQKAELAYELEKIEKERARQRQSEAGKLYGKGLNNNSIVPFGTNLSQQEKGKAAEIVSKKVCMTSSRNYYRAKTIIEKASEEVKLKLRYTNTTTISKEYEKIQRDKKRLEILSQINNNNNSKNNSLNTNCTLFYRNFIELQKEQILKDNSIDLIFTDPPYGKESLPLYEELAKLAAKVLKLGGSLVFLVGHIILDNVFNIFYNHQNFSANLKYWWTFAVKHSGHHKKIYPRNVFVEWKPLLWYVKGEVLNNLVVSNTIGDYIESTSPSKELHDWEQSPTEAEYIIKYLTLENQTVLDPMMGTGTTGIAAKKLHRKFIGIEIDEETFNIAKIKLGED